MSGFSEDTKVLMFDNTVKEIKDIVIGDLIWGNDNIPRKVLELFNGEDELYLVQQSRANNYIVTNNHPLILRATSIPIKYYKITNGNKYMVYYFIKCQHTECKVKNCSKKGFKFHTLSYNTEIEANDAKKLILSGELDPNYVMTPGIFVDYIVGGEK